MNSNQPPVKQKVKQTLLDQIVGWTLLLFVVFLGYCYWIGTAHLFVVVLYGVLTVVTFCAYFIDKKAAQWDRRRISESYLHLLSLFGGWPGAYLGQRYLRHKSAKSSFRLMFLVTVFVNVFVFAVLTHSLVQKSVKSTFGF
ncbi:DUF1294 domain-containing protein [Planctomicrobium sp. SH668]|uniref:DUF1294 domain-containing protein n=1 Tax=Planctomicrobium sp. SH668 TaxID=3448126 RepID=UPI003F5C7C7E